MNELKRTTCPEVIAALEELLERAKAGDMDAIIIYHVEDNEIMARLRLTSAWDQMEDLRRLTYPNGWVENPQ